MAEFVQIRHEVTGEERRVQKGSAPFFVNQGFVVLDAAGRKKAQQPATASDTEKEK